MATPEYVSTRRPAPAEAGWRLIAAAAGFVLLYLSINIVSATVTSSALPLPNASADEVRAWYVDNGLAASLTAACQVLSVMCLAAFVVRFRRVVTTGTRNALADRARVVGLVSVAAMLLSSVLAWTLTAVADGASLDLVSTLRTASFIAGGTAHVLALGVFVLLACRVPGMSKPVRILGYVAAVPAIASIVSLVVFQGAALILLGRVLCMIWAVTAAVSLTRNRAQVR